MRLSVVLALSSIVAATSSQAQDVAALADSVMRAAEARGFSGVVRLARNGSVVLERGYGLANRAEGIPFSPATIVQIGSNTKDFTAVSILQLQERGVLSVQDKLGKFFPTAPPDKKDVTVWQLMTHRAGFPLGLGGDFESVTRDQLVDRAMKYKLLFDPGANQSYSNTGFALLAAIIEKTSGKSYDEYVRDNILTPLGLTRTGFHLPKFSDRDLAHGYRAGGIDAGTMLSKAHAADGPYWNLRGNGGMLSTAADMHAFYKALFETDKLLKPATRNLRFDPSEPQGMAGSDLVNFFLYERDPRSGIEMIIASTNAEMKAPAVRRDLARVMGLPVRDGGRGGNDDGEGSVVRATGKPLPSAVAAIITEFIATINKGDASQLTRFVTEHFVITADAPAEQRAQRLSSIRNDLGGLKILRMSVVDDGSTQVLVQTEREGEALLILDMETTSPYRIKRLGLQVGG
jgi:CubicO group peptidase (beta-lactamase class C family)